MSRFNNILMVALRSIMKNKRRNIFTMVGIIIGIASVITIMSLGNGFKKTANDQFQEAGASKDAALINFLPSDGSQKGESFSSSDITLAQQVKGVTSAKIKEDDDQSYQAKITNAKKNEKTNIYKNSHFSDVSKGYGFNKDDNALEEKIVTIDKKTAKEVFDNDVVGQTLFIDNQGFKVVGISSANDLEPQAVHMPKKTFEHYFPYLKQDFAQLEIKVEAGFNKKTVAEKVAKTLNEKGSQKSQGQYQYSDTESLLKGISKVFDGITYFVAAVAGISLFIAGIGVMNVMYISVAERSEEIAIRRAFGAKARDIELQFLVESVVLCLIGGIIGLVLGIGLASLVDILTPDYIKSVVSVGSVLLAVGVSMLIGVVFGWIPARAAAKKELIDIIK